MATVAVDDGVCNEIVGDELGGHSALMLEIGANCEGSCSIVRFSGARKFNQEDPIEAASAEMILQLNNGA